MHLATLLRLSVTKIKKKVLKKICNQLKKLKNIILFIFHFILSFKLSSFYIFLHFPKLIYFKISLFTPLCLGPALPLPQPKKQLRRRQGQRRSSSTTQRTPKNSRAPPPHAPCHKLANRKTDKPNESEVGGRLYICLYVYRR